MATAATTTNHPECPVCYEGFNQPTLLPCAHLICRKCVVSSLEKGGCPLCQAGPSILPDSLKGQGDLASQVDSLPTAIMVGSKKTTPSGMQLVCSCCEVEEAGSFCLQCTIKLCHPCANIHARIPSCQDHVTEKLSDLTSEQLATPPHHHRSTCVHHSGKLLELYCPSHEELICALCVASTHHRQCSELQGIEDFAAVKREGLRALVQRLVQRERAVTTEISRLDVQMSDAQSRFKAMMDEVKAAFGDLRASVEDEELKLNAGIQAKEDTYLAERRSSKLELENLQAGLSAHVKTAERLVTSAPDRSLLGMLGNLTTRLECLESQVLPENPSSTPGCLSLKAATLDKAKKAVAVVGTLKDSEKDDRSQDECLWCGRSLEGQEFADMIKVGDRVRRGKSWKHGSHDGSPPGVGTVTHVADLKTGYVTVQWDCGSWTSGYCMGISDCYELKFVFDN